MTVPDNQHATDELIPMGFQISFEKKRSKFDGSYQNSQSFSEFWNALAVRTENSRGFNDSDGALFRRFWPSSGGRDCGLEAFFQRNRSVRGSGRGSVVRPSLVEELQLVGRFEGCSRRVSGGQKSHAAVATVAVLRLALVSLEPSCRVLATADGRVCVVCSV